ILKQARAFGLGLVVATQNPVDLDYKALSNAGTWMLGRLQTDRDKARVLDGLEGAATGSGASFDRARIDQLLSALGKRVFLLHNVHESQPTLFETRWTLSYLRGPLGRQEIRKLASPSVPNVPGVPDVPKAKFEPGTQQNQTPGTPGTSGTLGTAAASGPPVLDPAIPQFFVPGGERYVPQLLGVARVAYSDSKLGLDETRDVTVITPIGDGAVAVDWDQAEPADFSAKDLSKTAPASATFGDVPPAATRSKQYATWEKEFGQWIGRSQSIELFKSSRAKLLSSPDESERDFRIRIQGQAREERDAAVTKVRDKYASKLTMAQDRIRRAEQAVQVQNEQASGAKMGAALSVGATIFGALLGRKAISASSLGRATTAARGMSKLGKESQDVTRATENVNALKAQLAEIEASMQSDIQAVTADWDLANEPFERALVKPKRGGVSVQLVALVWVPE
ncbi:MAG TPA: hypothetical protein VF491_26310, partial [Vicinamibacterales bacterium]